ncbi:DUF6603 domain-containing protein [Spirillospora sp. NPDC049652]
MSGTVKDVKQWLAAVKKDAPIEVPGGLPDLKDFKSDIKFQDLSHWFDLGSRLKDPKGDAAGLTLTGKAGADVPEVRLRFFAGSAKPQEGDLIVGVEISVLLNTHELFKDLVGVGFKNVRLSYRIQRVGGETKKGLAVAVKLVASPERIVELVSELKDTTIPRPVAFTFRTPKLPGLPKWSLGDTFKSLSIDLPDLPRLEGVFPDIGNLADLVLEYTRTGKGFRVILRPAVQNRVARWAVAAVKADAEGSKAALAVTGLVPIGRARLSDIDILRGQIPPDSDLLLQLQAFYTLRDLADEDVAAVNAVLKDADGAPLPGGWPLSKGLTWCAIARIASEQYVLLARPKKQQNTRDGRGKGLEAASEDDALSGIPVALAGPAKGKNAEGPLPVQRSLGPLHLRNMTMRYLGDPPRVRLTLDASLVMAGLVVEAAGLGLEVELKRSPAAAVVLDGLGVAYAKPPLVVAGGLTKRTGDGNVDFAYDGGIVVKASTWGFMGFGSYAQMKDPRFVTLFLFGALLGKLAGPPPVTFTGLCAGFGYNSRVRIPEAAEAASSPFVGALTADGYKKLTGTEPGKEVTPATVVKNLGEEGWVTPVNGDIWATAGLGLSIAETVDLQALLLVQLGEQFAVALLGSAEIELPARAAKQVGGVVNPPVLAHVELGFRAMYEAAKGEFSLTAAFSDNSWLVHKECRLTGGAAIHLWTPPSPYVGDFVLSLGGYHPAFSRPAHYPEVPRLALTWSVGTAVRVHGELYAALTPAAGMVGGRLEVHYALGGLQAWLTAYFDALVQWAPLRFTAEMGITIGCSYTVKTGLFTVTIRAEISARLSLWGPPTGGVAHLEAGPYSVDIGFGSPRGAAAQEKLGWDEFRARQLPSAPVTVHVTEGLLTDPAHARHNTPDHWIAGTDGFTFATRSAVPVTSVVYNGAGQSLPKQVPASLDIRPTKCTGANSTHTVTFTRKGGTSRAAPAPVPLVWESAGAALGPAAGNASAWHAQIATFDVPQALWGAPVEGSPDMPADGSQTRRYACGLNITVPPPSLHGIALCPAREQLKFQATEAKVNPLKAAAKSTDQASGEPPDTARDTLGKKLTALGVLRGGPYTLTRLLRPDGRHSALGRPPESALTGREFLVGGPYRTQEV